MKSFRKVFASTALVVVGSMSVATMASAESIVGTGEQHFLPHSKQKPQPITVLHQASTPFRTPTQLVRVQVRLHSSPPAKTLLVQTRRFLQHKPVRLHSHGCTFRT